MYPVMRIIGVTITRVSMSRHIQKMALRECHSNIKITLHPILSKCDCTQNPPMPLCHPIETNASCANLAPRLLQVACIILHSLVRLITSDKTSIEYWHQYQSQQVTLHAARWQGMRLYYKVTLARHGARHEPKESIFL